MQLIRNLFIGLGLLTLTVNLHAQFAIQSGQIINEEPPAPADSIVQLTAEAQGLVLVAPENLPRCGTFWTVLPSGLSAPMPCPPQDASYPIFSIAPKGQFLVDMTGGQVSINPQLARRQTSTMAWNTALESLAVSVVDLIAKIQNPPPVIMATSASRMLLANNLVSSYSLSSAPYLSNLTASFAAGGGMNASFDITGGTNFVPLRYLDDDQYRNPAGGLELAWLGLHVQSLHVRQSTRAQWLITGS